MLVGRRNRASTGIPERVPIHQGVYERRTNPYVLGLPHQPDSRWLPLLILGTLYGHGVGK